MALPMAALAGPGHYLVLALDAKGQPQPQFYRRVGLALDPASIDAKALLPGEIRADGSARIALRAYRGARLLRAWTQEVAGGVRFEQADAAGRLQRYEVQDPERVFVVRVEAKADRIEVDSGIGSMSFDLVELAAKAGDLPLAEFAARLPQRAKGGQGPPGNRVDLLLMGDGFTAAEQTAFNAQADAAVAEMFDTSPQNEYRALVNVARLFTASNQSGADHPPYQAGCSSSLCCSDSGAQRDPRAGQFRDTAFDARFCTAQIHRLLSVSYSKVLTAAAAVPGWDKIAVLVNDPVYGGAGGSISVTSAHPSAVLVLIHEYGHSFTGLADEYTAPYPGYPNCSDLGTGPNCEANVTDQVDPALTKWRRWFTPGNPIPTPAGRAGVGLFQGARYRTSGMYRPVHDQCLMNVLGADGFCPVCREAYVLRLYRGGFGTPAAGIDLIEPGSESPATSATVSLQVGQTQRFSASVLPVTASGIELQWLLDGQPLTGAVGPQLDLRFDSATPAQRLLEFRVSDRSPFIKPEHAGPDAVHSRQWTLDVQDAGAADRLLRSGFEAGEQRP
ncbi:M64 family metallopeptidase [Pseudomarimonas salicorniae]|uniref:M64 family metallopeptidase n=1 Tax=Pseudomarimonas salicorniae TaxID=2933270 RepID=A0ABT0GDP7_9GAMM|nr:M64 family metallopeptidase [Lysobacter sp. CAU 1642]MCK7592274.1 M64 family metallopeptidase [Lysobacter sp. CAU 1642]